jgi:hypothetical protein
MRTSVWLLMLGFAFVVDGMAVSASEGQPHRFEKHVDEQSVSLIQLIANPEAFDGKRVVVGGFLVLRDEYEHSLFVDENAHRASLTANSVAADFDGSSTEIQARARQLDRRYVVVTGRFKAGATAFSGGKLEGIYGVVLIE